MCFSASFDIFTLPMMRGTVCAFSLASVLLHLRLIAATPQPRWEQDQLWAARGLTQLILKGGRNPGVIYTCGHGPQFIPMLAELSESSPTSDLLSMGKGISSG